MKIYFGRFAFFAIIISFISVSGASSVFAQSTPPVAGATTYEGQHIGTKTMVVYPGIIRLPSGAGWTDSGYVNSYSYSFTPSSLCQTKAKSTNNTDQYTVLAGCVFTQTATILGNPKNQKTTVYVFDQSASTAFSTGEHVAIVGGPVKVYAVPLTTSTVLDTKSAGDTGTAQRSFQVAGVTWWEIDWGGFVLESQLTSAPPTPGNIHSSYGADGIILGWDAISNGKQFGGYKVYRDGTYIKTVTTNLFTDMSADISVGKSYNYSISFLDGAGKESAQSPATTVTITTMPKAVAANTGVIVTQRAPNDYLICNVNTGAPVFDDSFSVNITNYTDIGFVGCVNVGDTGVALGGLVNHQGIWWGKVDFTKSKGITGWVPYSTLQTTSVPSVNGVLTIPDGETWSRDASVEKIMGTDGVQVTSWIFQGNSSNLGTVGSATFNNTSTNQGVVTGDAVFNGSNATYGSTKNLGSVKGSAVFTFWARNEGTVDGSATFKDNSWNYGTLNGPATFSGKSRNHGDITTGPATFSESSLSMTPIPWKVKLINNTGFDIARSGDPSDAAVDSPSTPVPPITNPDPGIPPTPPTPPVPTPDPTPTPVVVSLKITSPNGGETFTKGKTERIEWDGTGLTSLVIKLVKGKDSYPGKDGVITTQAADASQGYYEWTVPETLPDGTDYKISMYDTKQQKTFTKSAGTFSIVTEQKDPTPGDDSDQNQGDSNTNPPQDTPDSGDTGSDSGDTPTPVDNPSDNIKTIEATMTLSCPSGYSLNPNKDACVTGKIAVNIPTVKATVTYTCPTGYVLNSYKTSCKNNRERVVPSTASYSCPASYTLSQASKTCTAPVRPGSLTPTTTYSCPEGYSFNADEKTCTGQTGMKEGVLESANSWSSSVVNWASSIF